MKSLTFITSNESKVAQVKQYLDIPLQHRAIDLPEIQSLDLHEVVTAKAKAAFEIIQTPVLVEDTSLEFLALGTLPGPFIRWFMAELGVNGLCRLLDAYDNRTARASVCFGLYDGNDIHFFESEVAGSIAKTPRGGNGFGWDPIFIPEGQDKTWAEMTSEEQLATAVRRPALQKLELFLNNK